MGVNKHHPIIAHGRESVTGKKLGIQTGLRNVVSVTATVVAGDATTANKAPAITVVKTAGKGTIDIYLWKHTSNSNPTLVAATDAVFVEYTAIGE